MTRRMLPCAEALQAAQEAENLAAWKETGRVANIARKAAERATAAAMLARLDYHKVSIH